MDAHSHLQYFLTQTTEGETSSRPEEHALIYQSHQPFDCVVRVVLKMGIGTPLPFVKRRFLTLKGGLFGVFP